MSKSTKFNDDWTNPRMNPGWCKWLERVEKDENRAECKMCRSTFSLSNMGTQAVKSHEAGRKHKRNMNLLETKAESQLSLTAYFMGKKKEENTQQSESSIQSGSVIQISPQEPSTKSALSEEQLQTNDKPPTFPTGEGTSASSKLKKKDQFIDNALSRKLIKDKVVKAEILWAMRVVYNHMSYRSCSDISQFLATCFSDSNIAQQFKLGKTKVSYVIAHGIAPYFRMKLDKDLKQCKHIVVCFDEALNSIVQRGQMDLMVRFWDHSAMKVSTRYLTSVFLGHATAHDLLVKFKSGLGSDLLSKVIQVSMDGPAVNWKFLDEVCSDPSVCPEEGDMLQIGCCGLHVVHGAFQTGHKKVDWKVNETLRGMHRLFKDSPARRSDYTEITGSNQFPLKFCTTRWVENVSVSQRAIAVFDYIEKYVKSSKLPSTVTASAVKEAVEDPLTLAKLAFFGSVAGMVEPFLRRFQTDSPMVPFLYDELQRIMRKLMQRFIKSSELKKADTVKKLMKLNLEANLCTYKEVDIGVQASSTLNKSKVSEKMKMGFRIDCVKYLTAMVEKLRERCPLKYRLTRLSSALSPHTILRNASVGKQRLSELVQLLHECGKVSAVCADQAKLQYSDLCDMAESDLKGQFKDFDPYDNAQSLDTFFVTLLGNNKDQDALFEVMKIICTLSHGNAQVESGFSINGDVLVTNMQEESVVAQRQVYDAIHASGGLLNVDINASLMSYVRSSHSAYDDALKKKRQQQSEEEKRRIEKRKANEMIKELKAKKLKLNEDAKAENLEIQRKIDSLSKITKS